MTHTGSNLRGELAIKSPDGTDLQLSGEIYCGHLMWNSLRPNAVVSWEKLTDESEVIAYTLWFDAASAGRSRRCAAADG